MTAIDVDGTLVWIAVGANGSARETTPQASFWSLPDRPKLPRHALADGRMIVGTAQVARALACAPPAATTTAFSAMCLEAGQFVIERRDGRHGRARMLDRDGVPADLLRIVLIYGTRPDRGGYYLDRGSALAVIDADSMTIAAETPPICFMRMRG